MKHLLVAILALLALKLLGAQPAPNYSNEVLRLAKAAQIKAYLEQELNACDDFYEFTCHKWGRLHPATRERTRSSYLQQLQTLYIRKSAEMLHSANTIDTTADMVLKDFFESCHNRAALEAQGVAPILAVVDLKGGWPTITSSAWYEYEYDWLKVVAELRRKLGISILVGLEVIPDFEDKDMHRIKVGAPRLELGSRAAYLDEGHREQREAYKQNIAKKLRAYFGDISAQWAEEVASQVLEVEQQLAKGLPENPRLSLKQTTRSRYAAELKAAYGSYVDLSRYLTLIFNETIYTQVYETPEDYMSNLVEVIRQTPKLTIANYTMWRVLDKFDYASVLERDRHDPWCVHKVNEYFPQQLESMFHRNYNSMQVINELQSVWADVKRAFREQLQTSAKLNWLTLDTRQRAAQKLDAMDLQIVTHDERTLLVQLHVNNETLRQDKYIQNLVKVMHWQTQYELARLIDKPHSRATEVQLPHYQLTTNKVQIPIVFLQARFFWDAAYPHALKYSTLGTLLAQQMLQGFGALGRRYDKHGYQRSWWDALSEGGFDERAQCFAKEWSSVRGAKELQSSVLADIVARNGGLGVAYRAYQKWWKNAAEQELDTKENLPLLNYTQNQLFFIGAAQLWCSDYHVSTDEFGLEPERFYVNNALSNLHEFAAAYKCEKHTKMNPANKCTIY